MRLVGSDVEEASIKWCRENLPGIAFHVNNVEPPLTFAADNSFDVVFASSVFTHIDLKIQADWLAELRRVLRPGGFLLCDVHGEVCRRQVLSPAQEAQLQRDGGLVVYPREAGSSASPDVIGSCDAFQTEAETKRAFGAYFNIRDYIPPLRNLIIAQKTA